MRTLWRLQPTARQPDIGNMSPKYALERFVVVLVPDQCILYAIVPVIVQKEHYLCQRPLASRRLILRIINTAFRLRSDASHRAVNPNFFRKTPYPQNEDQRDNHRVRVLTRRVCRTPISCCRRLQAIRPLKPGEGRV